MDFDSSSKFISSLAKFLQSLCNGYVEFNNGVEVIGHIYINVDTGKKIDYVLNEKVCKTDENSVTFISNSFHAQPAEKPKQPEKTPKLNSPENENAVGSHDEIIIMDEPENENIEAKLERHEHHKPRPPKRSHNQEFSSSRGSKFSKPNQSHKHSTQNSVISSDSLHSENSSSNADYIPGNDNMTLASGTSLDHVPKVYPVSLSGSSKFHEEERDIKPQLDDLAIVNVKQEYDYSNQGEENPEKYNDPQGEEYTDMQYEYYEDGSEVGPDHSHMSHGDYYQEGAGISDGGASNSTASPWQWSGQKSINWQAKLHKPFFVCPFCKRTFLYKNHFDGHINTHLNQKSYQCTHCGTSFAYSSNLSRHKRTCKNI